LTLLLTAAETKDNMARYSAFLGRKVEVQYRAGDILLPASGTFVADSGRSIFLEQSFVQKGQQRNFRWEIPYQYIVRLEEKHEDPEEPGHASAAASTAPSAAEPAKPGAEAKSQVPENSITSGGAPGILPFQNRPKTA
jgi:hypothetical protein